MNMAHRMGLVVWMKDLKAAHSLGRFGNVHYVSKRMKYVYLYIDGDKVDQVIRQIDRLSYVQRVEKSQRSNICLDFERNETQLYTK
ncbi:YlbG family protein [Hazenella sp. IB182357]|uniref:YlbG family protein n=1 Tax=Polycladospora coralii TaxID=2771432 RepID=A0A926N4T0_9BACL|nr:YlbG family protein [Polycladospora coralii]MBD1370969.1 YlbG family protein [Polycladospora coralii]MBS7529908.1 YlbG family protein [Polycladospora coralii]